MAALAQSAACSLLPVPKVQGVLSTGLVHV